MLRIIFSKTSLAFVSLFWIMSLKLFATDHGDKMVTDQMALFDIKFYRFNLEATNENREISGWAEIQARSLENPIDTIVLQLSLIMNVDSVLVDNVANDYIHADQVLKIPSSIAPDQDFGVKVYYHGSPVGNYFQGIHRQFSADYGRWVTWTFSQPFYAYKWFPCKQMHEDKIDSLYMVLTTDSSLMAVSSGQLYAITPLDDGKVMYEWRTKYAINYDLIFFAVSDYILYDYYVYPAGNSDSIHITHYVYNQEYLEDYQARLDSIGLFVEYFSDIFGPYPFADECFGLVVVPGIPSMVENNTMVTMIEDLELGITHTFIDGNCHELAHQWFGDFVACHTFADIWLSEGFGMYGGYLGEQQFGLSGSDQDWLEKTRNDAFAPQCGSVHVPESQLSDPYRIFNWQLTYCKGSMVLHMIRYILHDDELFFSVLQNYIDDFGNGTSVLDDFKNTLEQISGMDFTTFFEQWYYGQGHPLLDISWEFTDDTLHIYSQESTSCDTTPFFEFTMDYQLIFEDGDTVFRLIQDDPFEHYALPLDQQVVDIFPDPDHWILVETNIGHVGIEKGMERDGGLLYPNPCSGVLNIRYNLQDEVWKAISIYDLCGKLVMRRDLNHGTMLNLDGLPAGIYYIILENGSYKIPQKIVLQ